MGTSGALFRSTWPFWRSNLLPRGSPGRPGLRFWSPKRLFFSRHLRAASVRRAKRPTSIKHWQERYETHFEAAARRPKTFEHRTASASNCVWRCQRRFRASWEWSRRLLERLWGAPGTLMDASWSLLARPGRPLIGLGAALWRPKTVPSVRTRSRNGLGRPNRPLIVFRTIFRSFWGHFHRFSIDFSSIFARAACDEGTESESQERVA